MNTQIDAISGLDATRYERARRMAEDAVRASVPKPDPEQYQTAEISEHPRGVMAGAWAALIIIGIAAFWISAGKQIAATDLLLMPIVADYGNRLSPFWADSALVLTLTLGELGTILFTMSGALLGARRYTLAAFWAAAMLCAGLALVANITITSLHLENIAAVPVFGWLLTVAPPIVVLFVGLYAERLLLKSLEGRTRVRVAYAAALAIWRQMQEKPAEHPDFMLVWYRHVFEQLTRLSPANRAKIAAAVQADPGVRLALVRREIARHSWAFEPNENSSQTTILSVTRPALSNGVHTDADGANGEGETLPNAPNEQTSNKVDAARAWLTAHPDAANLSVSAAWAAMVADGLQVGRDSVYRAMRA